MKYSIVFVSCLLFGAMWFGSCNSADTYKAELSSIDTALAELDSAEVFFDELPVDTLSKLFKKVKTDMKLVTESYEGEMSLELGTTFSRYRDVPNNIKNFSDVLKNSRKEIALTQAQLNKLKQAILDGANRDAKGNVIDEEYIKKNVGVETKVAHDIVEQMKALHTKAEKAFADYDTYYPQVSATLDSLKALN